jgi:Kef-type K+ transport system membrane component KefB
MHGHSMQLLLVLVLLTVLGPFAALRLRLPAAVVLILLGVLAGPGATGLLRETPMVALLSELGFLILMFIAGMEIDFSRLRQAGPRALLGPGLASIAFMVLALILGRSLGLGGIEILIISATSVGLPLAVLQETGQLRRPLGQEVMLTASIAEFVSIIGIVGYEMASRHGVGFRLAFELAKILILLFGSAALIRVARAVVWWYPEPFRRMVDHHDVAELGVRSGLLLMLMFVALAALLGVESILGAFIAGALVAFVLREKHALEAKIAALGHGLFIPIFFVVVGLRFDPNLITAGAVIATLKLMALVMTVKFIPTLFLMPPQLGLRERLAAGCMLSAPLTLVVAIGAIGLRLKLITPQQGASTILLAIFLSVIFPVLFRLLVPRPAEP